MKYITLIFLLLFMKTFTNNSNAQNFSNHKWENRLVLILTDNINNEKYLSQVKELNKHPDDMVDRKIVVYHITPTKFKLGLSGENWQNSETYYNIYKKTTSQPEIILIGLDGGVKHRAKNFFPAKSCLIQ